jgi:hypothetical protein
LEAAKNLGSFARFVGAKQATGYQVEAGRGGADLAGWSIRHEHVVFAVFYGNFNSDERFVTG